MNGVSTITQKGQVAIPHSIRKYFKIKPHDKIRFAVEQGKIVAQVVPGVQDMLGMVASKKSLSKKEYKTTVKKRILKKYGYRS